MKKKVDSRIRTLIENGVENRHRSFFVLIGDKGKDQIVNLHYILSKASVKSRPSVLWCYKKQVKKLVQRGLLDPNKDDPFELFISSTQIRWCYYKETQKVLGSTYGMCVLQDFETLTPNLLARTIETVEGGGIVVLLLKTLSSLKQLFTMTMEAHDRYRTESHQQVVGRFNERFLLSLGDCKDCLVVDDELNILPISSHARGIRPVVKSDEDPIATAELKELKASLADTQPIGPLVEVARTVDQARAILTFVEAISEKTLRSTVALTAGRGRGKSAALGVSIAAAIAHGYSNVFVTSPSPENLKTLFEFVFKAFDSLGYAEHADYELIQSTNPEFMKAIVRVNVFRSHRQTIQYIAPHDWQKLGQAELVVIDEAAAIPLPLVKKLLGPYLVFLSSTVNGYEGTGRALSHKLIQQLREQGRDLSTVDGGKNNDANSSGTQVAAAGRVFRDVTLNEPIRYAAGDKVEAWLNGLLCLEANDHIPRIIAR
jgi:N-acetyltransferase 10